MNPLARGVTRLRGTQQKVGRRLNSCHQRQLDESCASGLPERLLLRSQQLEHCCKFVV